jgi:hypothetical protein
MKRSVRWNDYFREARSSARERERSTHKKIAHSKVGYLIFKQRFKTLNLEAGTGVEPVYTALQAAA